MGAHCGKRKTGRRESVAEVARLRARILVGLELRMRKYGLHERASSLDLVTGKQMIGFGQRIETRKLRRGGAFRRGERIPDAAVLALRFAQGRTARLFLLRCRFRGDMRRLEGGSCFGRSLRPISEPPRLLSSP